MKAYNFSKEKLDKLYNKEGLTLREMAKQLKCSPETILNYFLKYNMKRRKKGINNNLLIKNPQAIFKPILPPYWIVGFVDGEGSFCFRHEINQKALFPVFTVAQKNRGVLKKIKSCFPNLLFTLDITPSNPVWKLYTKQFKNCYKLLSFFDKYPPLEKENQYNIWKFLIKELIKNDFDWDTKEKIWFIYKKEKEFGKFVREYQKIF